MAGEDKVKMENRETAILGGGCFWCIEAVFELLKGVEKVESGYSGGLVEEPSYQEVCRGTTDPCSVFHPGSSGK